MCVCVSVCVCVREREMHAHTLRVLHCARHGVNGRQRWPRLVLTIRRARVRAGVMGHLQRKPREHTRGYGWRDCEVSPETVLSHLFFFLGRCIYGRLHRWAGTTPMTGAPTPATTEASSGARSQTPTTDCSTSSAVVAVSAARASTIGQLDFAGTRSEGC
eukprot:COSAG05_NODE_4330_length_1564_cov_9.148123_1_plen_160_part_00